MKYRFMTGLIVTSVSTLALTNACGEQKTHNKNDNRKNSPHHTRSITDVPNLTGNQDALALIQSLSANDSASAPSECISILTQSPQDLEWRQSATTNQTELREFYCHLDEGSLSHFFHNKVSNSSTSNEGGGIDAGIPIEGIPLTLKLNASSVRGKNYTQEMANQDAATFKKQACSENERSQNQGHSEQILRKYASSVTLDKFNQCLTVRQKGFFCQIAETNEGVAAVVRWEPNEVVRKHLPKVLLSFSTTENLELASNIVPQVLGIGTGQAISYRRKDPTKGSLLQVVANDAGNAVSLACSRTLPAVKTEGKKVWAQHSFCGEPLVKNRDIFQTFEEPDTDKPVKRIIPGAVKPTIYKGHNPCGHADQYNRGRKLCTDQNLIFISAKYVTKECWIHEGIFTGTRLSSNVYATCREHDTEETTYPHMKSVSKKVGTESKAVIRACEIERDIPGVVEISEDQARAINNLENFDAD